MKTSCVSRAVFLGFCAAAVFMFGNPSLHAAEPKPPAGFVSLFNGKDFANWKVPEGDNGHWKIVDGAIDYDAESEAKGGKDLVTEREFKDYVLSAGRLRPPGGLAHQRDALH